MDIQNAVTMQGEALQQGEIQILHATPEQISQLQHAQHIQILQGDHVLQVRFTSNRGFSIYSSYYYETLDIII